MTDFLPPVVLKLAADISEYSDKLAIASAQLKAFAAEAPRHLKAATPEIAAAGRAAGKVYGDAVPEGVRGGADRAVEDVVQRLGAGRGRLEGEGRRAGEAAGGGFGAGASAALGGAWQGVMVTGITALVGAFAQLTPVVGAAAAALASLPAAGAAAAGALVTLAAGFHGLGGAIHAAYAPAMGGAAQSATQVASAEWSLQQAQRAAISTQEALTIARQAAAQNIKDLALAMSGAKLQVEEATLAVSDAQAAYNQALATGNPDTIYRSNLALREAKQRLDEVNNSADKTAATKADADQRGVEGSQQVQQALDAQRNAQHSLEQAQLALAAAMHQSGGAADALSTAMAGLAPNAQAVVREFQSLKPALHDIQQTTQQHMFAGIAGDLKELAGSWLPAAKAGMTGLADGFNSIFHSILHAAAAPQVVKALSGLFASLADVLKGLGPVLGRLVGTFAQLTTAATPFLHQIGEGAIVGLGHFADLIDRMAKDGRLAKMFSDAGETLHALGGLLHDVWTILSSVFTAMQSAGTAGLGAFGALIHAVAEFVSSAQGMAVLREVFAILGQVANAFGDTLGKLLPIVGDLLAAILPAVQPIVDLFTGQFLPIIVDLASQLAAVLIPVIQALAPVIAQLAVALVPLVQQLLPVLIPIVQLVARVFLALLPAVMPLVNLLIALLVPILRVLSPIIKALTPILVLVADAFTALVTPIAEFIGWLTQALTSATAWKAVGKWFTDIWNDIKGAFRVGVQWVKDQWNGFIEDMKAIPRRVLQALGDFTQLLYNAGKDLLTGLWNGIKSMGGWIWDKLKNFVHDNITQPVKDFFGISSPSKLMAEMGQWIPRGLAVGIDGASGYVTDAAARLAAAAVPDLSAMGSLSLGGFSGGSLAVRMAAPHPTAPTASSPGYVPIVVNLGGTEMARVHAALIQPAQRYKQRTGVTGLA